VGREKKKNPTPPRSISPPARLDKRIACKIVCGITVPYFKIKNAWTSNSSPPNFRG
jgi:hypothetical protein